jgi:hypothetical protein
MLARRRGDVLELCHERTKEWFYWIPLSEIQTRRGLIRWIDHLTEKEWITARHIHEMIAIAKSIHTF